MYLRNLCMHCMRGGTESGCCSYCHTKAGPEPGRPSHALPFQTLLHERYDIGRVIGCGGFGITYLAWDRKTNERVAVKELYPGMDVVRDKEKKTVLVRPGQEDFFEHVKKRFLEEAKLLFQFQNYPEILKVSHLFAENGTAYYVMEYLEGRDLKAYLKGRGKMGWGELSGYVRPILASIGILHDRDLIHRDISPDNILILGEGRAKLIDFGSVRCYSGTGGLTTFLKHNFAPFEQYRMNGKQGPWTDVYALGVTIYYALSGVLPPKAPDRVQKDEAVHLSALCPGLPPHVAKAVMCGMAVYPEQRFQTISSFAEALYPGESVPPSVRDRGVKIGTAPAGERGIACIQGYFAGKRWKIAGGVTVSIGRNRTCSIFYPTDSPGISRVQCLVAVDTQGRLFIRDEASTYGTFTRQGRLAPRQWKLLPAGAVFAFAGEKYQIF